MNTRHFLYTLLICILLIGCSNPTITPLPTLPVGKPVNEPFVLPAVANKDSTCYFADNLVIQITILRDVPVLILKKNSEGDLVKVKLNDVIDCWIALESLDTNRNNLVYVSEASSSPTIPTPTLIPNPTPLPVGVTLTPATGLLIQWKIVSYDCVDGKAQGVTIDLIVSGGVEPYSFSPKLPIYAKPGQDISVTVQSKTDNGKPDGLIKFPVPEAKDRSTYSKCEQAIAGNVPAPTPAPIETQAPVVTEPSVATKPPEVVKDPPVVVTDPPTTEPVCYNPQGKEIPCHDK